MACVSVSVTEVMGCAQKF